MSGAAPRSAVSDAPTGLGPVAPMLVTSLALVIVGGIWLASYFPRADLTVPTSLGGLAALLLLGGYLTLLRAPAFSWTRFGQIWRWAILAYAIVAGLIDYAFVTNGTRGRPLLLVSAMLAVFALDVASVIAFTVARHHETPAAQSVQQTD